MPSSQKNKKMPTEKATSSKGVAKNKRSNLKMSIDLEWCKRCGICAQFCPKHALEMEESGPVWKAPEECIRCRLCESRCPDMAIEFESEEDDS